jgi:hypothetical protein
MGDGTRIRRRHDTQKATARPKYPAMHHNRIELELLFMKGITNCIRRHWLGLALWVIVAIGAFLVVKSSGDPLAPKLEGTELGLLLSQFSTGNEIVFNMTVGILVTLIIFALVVWVPEQSKRRRIRRNMARQYDSFKEECIKIYFWALQESYDTELMNRMKARDQFRAYFKEEITRGQDRWDGVQNGLTELLIRNLIAELEILRSEVIYTLGAIDIEDEQAYAFLKHLNQVLFRIRSWSEHDEELKLLSRFLWSVHTGWSVIDGYTDKDVIADMIRAI